MKFSILPKSPLSTPQPHTGVLGVLTIIGLIIRVVLQLADHANNLYDDRREKNVCTVRLSRLWQARTYARFAEIGAGAG